jgi:multiple sugar transport system permease protein
MAVQTVRKPLNPPNRGASSRDRREWLTAYLFIAPYLVTVAIFTIGLLIYAFYTSLTNRTSTLQRTVQFVGFNNYLTSIRDVEFLISLINVFWYFLFVTTLQTIGAILVAVLLNAPLRGQRIFRTLFYAPSVASPIVMSMIFLWLYIRTGFINSFLGTNVAWLQDARGLFEVITGTSIQSRFLKGPSVTWMALMAMNIYSTIPTLMLLFLAALQDIPGHLYEAASIDGAGKLRQFFSITLPLLRPTILTVVVLGTIGTMQVFDQAFVMTEGGPNRTTLTPVLLIYTRTLGAATQPRAGQAAAMAFILAVIIFALTYIQRRYIESGTERV